MSEPTCAAGRRLIRREPYRGLDWSTPCPRPVADELPLDPPMPFCAPHLGPVLDDLEKIFVEMGLL